MCTRRSKKTRPDGEVTGLCLFRSHLATNNEQKVELVFGAFSRQTKQSPMIVSHIQSFREYRLALFQLVPFQSTSSALKIHDREKCAPRRKKAEMSGEEPGKQEECRGNCLTRVCLQKQSESSSVASGFPVIWVLFLNQGHFIVFYKYKFKEIKCFLLTLTTCLI